MCIKASGHDLSDEQWERADLMAEICIDEWETYGVLPSVCIAQAFIESTLGKFCRGNNLWGICSGGVSYDSLEDGIYGYLKVINNGYYPNAPFKTNYKEQIRAILDGGYCQPEGDYYNNVLWAVEYYNLTKYDKALFDELERREKQKEIETEELEKQRISKRCAEQVSYTKHLALERNKYKDVSRIKKQYAQEYTFVYLENIPDHCVAVDKSFIPKDVVLVYKDLVMLRIYDTIDGGKGYTIGTSDKSLVGKKVYINVMKNAVGWKEVEPVYVTEVQPRI